MEHVGDFPLELLTQLSVLLVVHFARLEIELQLTYGFVQCVFLLQQTCSAIDVQVCFWKSRRPVGVPNRFLRSSVQTIQIPCRDAWQNTPALSRPRRSAP